ncbi:hypothetical protein COCNU_contig68572519G000010 [Cocos nucifera]|nr:hypothetical protein [Cocos nucifera]
MVFSSDNILPVDISSVWERMEECQQQGLAKSIGVSNFTCKKLAELLTHAKVLPAVNQVGSLLGIHILDARRTIYNIYNMVGNFLDWQTSY